MGTKFPDLQRLRRNDRAMIRCICGTKLDDDIPTAALHQKLGVVEITSVLRIRRLRWFGHVQRASSCISSVTSMEILGRRGRPRKAWSECVSNDVSICNMSGTDPRDREGWRAGVRRCQPQ
ncbi:uncharacterized protein LOC134839813 [Symsagittifera roscoffensis]|uniref:uncharacterized protein LOC134839813 n=1 Tax=Symsagittifera roscoffensis TaxID=84072 RepID=UPI00307C9B30